MSDAALFKGLSAFPITPLDAEEQVDTDALARLMDRLISAPIDSIGLLGSTGGYAYLTISERQHILELAIQQTNGKVPLIAGVGALQTKDALLLARHAEQSGADGLLLAPVSYTPLTQEEVYQHFATIADATALPVCIYNNPGTTHFTFSRQLLLRLAQLPTIAAVKMPPLANGDYATELADLRAGLPENFVVGYSGDWVCSESVRAGADSFFSGLAGLLPVPMKKLFECATNGDAREIERLDAAFEPLWTMFRQFGSVRVIIALAKMLELADASPPRPILPLPDSEWRNLKTAFNRVADL